ncbi:MAG: c-type cytochrome [Rhizobacter sp.]|nr:c-type cytochrome [Burkholderiales bacterium]
MKKIISLFIALIAASAANIAFADYDLLVKSNCLACHNIDKNLNGPKLKDVAEKYANDATATERLAKKIKSGGTGVWGEDMMPPQAQLTDANALILAKYILSLK